MKNSITFLHRNALHFIVLLALLLSSCTDDVKTMMKATPGSITLDAASTSVVLDSAQASSTIAETFNWNAPDYGVQLSKTYTLELDSANGTFEKPVTVVLDNKTSQDYTKKTFNDLALSLRLLPGQAGQIKARVRADVNSNVEPVYSNVVNITITPYSTKPTPKYPVPDVLFIVGDATPGAWGNPVPTPSQQFTKIDDYTFGIVLQLTGGKEYLFLPKNGSWDHKYNVTTATSNPDGDTFAPDAGNNNIKGPGASGLYKIVVDFVTAKYTVTLLSSNPVPDNLFIVGDATAGAWANPVPTPSQQFTQISNAEYQISLPLTGGKTYLFLPKNGDWSHKYGGTSKTGGALLADNDVPGSNTPAPDASGNYVITVNFLSKQYTVTPQ